MAAEHQWTIRVCPQHGPVNRTDGCCGQCWVEGELVAVVPAAEEVERRAIALYNERGHRIFHAYREFGPWDSLYPAAKDEWRAMARDLVESERNVYKSVLAQAEQGKEGGDRD